MPSRAMPAVAGAICLFVPICSNAFADEEILIRRDLGFAECRQTVHSFLDAVAADPANVRTEADTGAHYRIRVSATDANLLIGCNAVAGQIAVIRVTPGDLAAVSE